MRLQTSTNNQPARSFMQFDITFRNSCEDHLIVQYIERRLSFAFAGVYHCIEHSEITVSDIISARGSIDRQCQITLEPKGLAALTITETHSELRSAIDRCFYRASQKLTRQLARSRQPLMTVKQ